MSQSSEESSSESTRQLVASQAAWLVRVNDDRVRAWFKDPKYPPDPGQVTREWTTWDDLARYRRERSRSAPLPLALLDMPASDVEALLATSAVRAEHPGHVGARPTERVLPTAGAWKDAGGSAHAAGASGQSGATQADYASAVARLRRDLAQSRIREEGLRRALREQLAALGHSQDEAAAQRRSITAMVDAAEELAREP